MYIIKRLGKARMQKKATWMVKRWKRSVQLDSIVPELTRELQSILIDRIKRKLARMINTMTYAAGWRTRITYFQALGERIYGSICYA